MKQIAEARLRIVTPPRLKAGSRISAKQIPTSQALKCKRRFLRFFPNGFRDETYLAWERDYKVETHQRWQQVLGEKEFARLLTAGEFIEIAKRAIRVEQQSRHSMIFSFEKMALRDAIKSEAGAQTFSEGLYDYLHGAGELKARFDRWVLTVDELPRRQTRVLTWPLVTVFGFIAQPQVHMFLKPNVSKAAAQRYGFEFLYASRPNWQIYANMLAFAEQVRRDMRDLKPRDMIDLQSFIWVQGSDEYA